MTLSQSDKKRFRKIGHGLKPIVSISGKGLTEGVLKELSRALADHELIKIKLHVEDNAEKKQLLEELETKLGKHTTLVQSVGHTALLFSPAKEPNPRLSNLLRHSAG